MTTPAQPQPDCTAVLMAGGASSRMGEDKAWLPLRGRPLWRAQLDKLVFAREILISTQRGRFPAPDGTGQYRLLFDEFAGAGPLAGLHAGLKAATCPRVVVLAVDMPAMTSDFLRGLAEEATDETGVVPEIGGRVEPLAAVYPKRLLLLVEEFLRLGDYSLQHLVRAAAAQGLVTPQPVAREHYVLFENWNRPEDVTWARPR